MKLELTLMELNTLYIATDREVKHRVENFNLMKGVKNANLKWFSEDITNAEVVRDKVQTALYKECARLDNAIERVASLNVPDMESDLFRGESTEDDEDAKLHKKSST